VWEFTLVTTADAPPERLWGLTAAAADRAGRRTTEDSRPPTRYAEESALPLVRVVTVHEFEPAGAGTRVRVTIRYRGPLALLWGSLFGQRQARELAERTRRLVGQARREDHPGGPPPLPRPAVQTA